MFTTRGDAMMQQTIVTAAMHLSRGGAPAHLKPVYGGSICLMSAGSPSCGQEARLEPDLQDLVVALALDRGAQECVGAGDRRHDDDHGQEPQPCATVGTQAFVIWTSDIIVRVYLCALMPRHRANHKDSDDG